MARIKVKDLPTDYKISTGELKRLRGGHGLVLYEPIIGGEAPDSYGQSWFDRLAFSPRSVFFDKTRSVIHKIY